MTLVDMTSYDTKDFPISWKILDDSFKTMNTKKLSDAFIPFNVFYDESCIFLDKSSPKSSWNIKKPGFW